MAYSITVNVSKKTLTLFREGSPYEILSQRGRKNAYANSDGYL